MTPTLRARCPEAATASSVATATRMLSVLVIRSPIDRLIHLPEPPARQV